MLALGDFRSAIADFDRALDPREKRLMTFVGRFSTRYPELHRARSEARRRLGDLDGALVDLDAALGLDPDDAEARVRRGHLHATRRDFARAIADFDKAIALGRGDAEIYNARGDARAAAGDEAGAKADRDRADLLREKSAPAHGSGTDRKVPQLESGTPKLISRSVLKRSDEPSSFYSSVST